MHYYLNPLSRTLACSLPLAIIASGTYTLLYPSTLASTWGVPELADRPLFRVIGVHNVGFGLWVWKIYRTGTAPEIISMSVCVAVVKVADCANTLALLLSHHAAEVDQSPIEVHGNIEKYETGSPRLSPRLAALSLECRFIVSFILLPHEVYVNSSDPTPSPFALHRLISSFMRIPALVMPHHSFSESTTPYYWGKNEHSIVPHAQLTFSFQPRDAITFSFCEEKYIVSPYIAEFMNAITSLAYTDQLTMHIFSSALLYYSLSPCLPASRALPYRRILASLILLETTSILNFLISNNTALHQYSFVSMCGLVTALLICRVERVWGPKAQAALTAALHRGCSLVSLWLRAVAPGLPYLMPVSWMFEMHGWWYVCSAVAGYNYIQTIEALDEYGKKIARNENVRERKNSETMMDERMKAMSVALPRR
ncbi:uncharacterized protein BDZ99DRAFT_478953 [Mytilinidion resinicola]|uniref:Uncharacterized protein n=1 Tax=Mytilinidion resinicola TaxID=574789 RepID=A0A6A6YFB8_9PEZI|nr:uncharacterized protein BDZ99DRAFT_478953 [Mytilinidion resinicola]KAF2807482.1 hypothetical protein BDZ99DRAFT_478953 [Mytilinidion resinicola]